MIKIIKKNCVFIVSTGRTGTQFLAKNLGKMIHSSQVFHEPGTPWITRPEEWPELIKQYGLFHLTLGQLRSDMSMFKLSTELIRGNLSIEDAKVNLLEMRESLINNINEKIYIEASGHLFGAVEILNEVIPSSKFIFIIRDPRDWVKSAMNTFEYILYGPLDLNFLNLSIKAKDIKKDEYQDKWSDMSKFEKYCWYYNKVNSYILDKLAGKRNFRVYRHQDLFNKREIFYDMLKFASRFENGFKTCFSYNKKLMKKVHSNASKEKFPNWQEWDEEMIEIFNRHCGKWMEDFDFADDIKWKEKLKAI